MIIEKVGFTHLGNYFYIHAVNIIEKENNVNDFVNIEIEMNRKELEFEDLNEHNQQRVLSFLKGE